MNKTTRNMLLGAGITAVAVAGATASANAVTKYLVNCTLDRELPGSWAQVRSLFQANTGTDTHEILAEKTKHLQNLDLDPVEITSYDGHTLSGYWRPARDPKRIILAMHGWRSSWADDFGVISDFWYDNGCSVLYAEQRGHGDSEGEYIGMGLLEQYDCREWSRYLTNTYGKDIPLYLAGVSMGATTVMLSADLNLPSNVRGMIADCGFTSLDEIWQHIAKDALHLPYELRKKYAHRLCERKLQITNSDCSTIQVLKDSTIPSLFIHGTEDPIVPVEMTYRNYEACTAPKHLFIVPGAGHGGSYLADPAGYQSMILQFFSLYDGTTT